MEEDEKPVKGINLESFTYCYPSLILPGLQLFKNAALSFTREVESCWKRCLMVVVSFYTSMMREGLAKLLHFWNGRFVSKLVGFIYLLKRFVTILCMFGNWEPSWSALQLRLVETALDMKCHGHYTGFFILKSGVLLVSFSKGSPKLTFGKTLDFVPTELTPW